MNLNQQVATVVGYDEGWIDRNPQSVPDFLNDWSATGPLIEEYNISICKTYLSSDPEECWSASNYVADYNPGGVWVEGSDKTRFGKTALEAVCKHLVAK
jgi:hypothetical protein